MDKPIKTLLIEDNPKDARLIREMLKEAGEENFHLEREERLSQALKKISAEKPDLILLDPGLPDSQGLDTFIKVHQKAPQVPIIVITDLDDEKLAAEAVRLGAQDYLVKGQVYGSLLAKSMRYAIERKRAEEALRANEEKYRSIFETTVHMINLVDKEGIVVDCNSRVQQVLGYLPEEIIGQPMDKIVHPDFIAKVKVSLEEIFAKGFAANTEYKMTRKDGTIVDVSINSSALRNGNGEFVRATCIIEDISERKRAEEAIQTAKEWRTTFNTMPDLVMLIDHDNRITRANKATSETLGFSLEEMLGRKCFEYVHGTEAPPEFCPHARTIADGKEHTAEIYDACSDKHFLVTTTPRFDDFGTLNGSVHIMRDITERKRAEEERIRLATAIEQSEEAILITDVDAAIQYVNPAFERITGYSREEIVGQNPRILKSGKHDEAFYKQMWDTLTRGETWSGRFINKRKGGTIYEEYAMISPVRDSSGKIINYVAVEHDATQEIALREKLFQTEKLAAIGEIAAVIAHEIKNPIFAISSSIQILQGHLKLNDDEQETLDIVFRQIMRVDRLIKQLLTYSVPQELNITPNQINEIISEVVSLNRGLSRSRKIKIREKISKDMAPVYVDKDRITQVLINLLQNAIDVSKEGDCIEISCRIDMENQRAVIKVKDEGPGIPEDQRGKVFDLFFSGKNGNSGMGLAISKKIVLDHGGDIGAEPRKKRGTAMVVGLPLREDNA